MGTNLALLAVKGKSKDDIWATLSIEPVCDEFAPIKAAQLATGWYVILELSGSYIINSEEKLSALASDAELFVGGVVTTCNYTMISEWKLGKKSWEVVYLQDQGGLSISGHPPKEYAWMKDKVRDMYNPTDESDTSYGEVPKALFEYFTGYTITGFRSPREVNHFEYFRARPRDEFPKVP